MAVPLNGFLPPPRHWEPPGWCSDNGAVPFKYHRPCEHLRVQPHAQMAAQIPAAARARNPAACRPPARRSHIGEDAAELVNKSAGMVA